LVGVGLPRGLERENAEYVRFRQELEHGFVDVRSNQYRRASDRDRRVVVEWDGRSGAAVNEEAVECLRERVDGVEEGDHARGGLRLAVRIERFWRGPAEHVDRPRVANDARGLREDVEGVRVARVIERAVAIRIVRLQRRRRIRQERETAAFNPGL